MSLDNQQQNVLNISMNEAIYLLAQSEKSRQQERVNQQKEGKGQMYEYMDNNMTNPSQLGALMNLNDEVVNQTKDYLAQFCQFKESYKITKSLRAIAKQYKISTDLAIHICDLGLRDYEEAVSLYPELQKKEFEEGVMKLLEEVKLNNS